jgi:hypothetical protein
MDHAYDAGSPRDDSEGCIADVSGLTDCGEPEERHVYTEYPKDPPVPVMDQVRRGRGGRGQDLPPGKFERAVGAMHEPRPYLGELDWPPLAQQPETD